MADPCLLLVGASDRSLYSTNINSGFLFHPVYRAYCSDLYPFYRVACSGLRSDLGHLLALSFHVHRRLQVVSVPSASKVSL
jgi:hypothetical protein